MVKNTILSGPISVNIKGYIKDQEKRVKPEDKIKDYPVRKLGSIRFKIRGGKMIESKGLFSAKVHSHHRVWKSMIAHSLLRKKVVKARLIGVSGT